MPHIVCVAKLSSITAGADVRTVCCQKLATLKDDVTNDDGVHDALILFWFQTRSFPLYLPFMLQDLTK